MPFAGHRIKRQPGPLLLPRVLLGLLGIVKGKSISTTMIMRLTNQTVTIDFIDKMVVLGSMLLAVTYIMLLYQVVEVYSPKEILYSFFAQKKGIGAACEHV